MAAKMLLRRINAEASMKPRWEKYPEVRTASRKRCPKCDEHMIEVEMPEFGPRWQCEDCRITVFLSGGIQPWRTKEILQDS